MLEIASPTTARNDYTEKRDDYAALGVQEYWRFDPTGGQLYDAPLAGDRLEAGAYRPIPIIRADETHYRGHSKALGLELCWEEGQLRWWDPAEAQYLRTYERSGGRGPHQPRKYQRHSKRRKDASPNRNGPSKRRAMPSKRRMKRIAERNRADRAEARVRELEEELRLRDPG